MAIPFTRSMRALYADSHFSTLVSLSVALVLLLVWAAWFFLAQITLSTTGQIVTTTREGTIIAAFPAAAKGTLRRGQQARVHLQGNSAAQAVVSRRRRGHATHTRGPGPGLAVCAGRCYSTPAPTAGLAWRGGGHRGVRVTRDAGHAPLDWAVIPPQASSARKAIESREVRGSTFSAYLHHTLITA